jgi:hypothetical protein
MTPLTMLILISLFLAFAVLDNPDGTLAHVTSFIPFAAPMTLPPRIALGEASAWRSSRRSRSRRRPPPCSSRWPGGSTAARSCAPARR